MAAVWRRQQRAPGRCGGPGGCCCYGHGGEEAAGRWRRWPGLACEDSDCLLALLAAQATTAATIILSGDWRLRRLRQWARPARVEPAEASTQAGLQRSSQDRPVRRVPGEASSAQGACGSLSAVNCSDGSSCAACRSSVTGRELSATLPSGGVSHSASYSSIVVRCRLHLAASSSAAGNRIVGRLGACSLAACRLAAGVTGCSVVGRPAACRLSTDCCVVSCRVVCC
jgi:hypothetical protein